MHEGKIMDSWGDTLIYVRMRQLCYPLVLSIPQHANLTTVMVMMQAFHILPSQKLSVVQIKYSLILVYYYYYFYSYYYCYNHYYSKNNGHNAN